eukprot:gene31504-6689_t
MAIVVCVLLQEIGVEVPGLGLESDAFFRTSLGANDEGSVSLSIDFPPAAINSNILFFMENQISLSPDGFVLNP